MSDINNEFHKTFEFKGKDLQPFSEGRRAVAMSIGVRMGGDPAPSLMDVHALLFILLCSDKKVLAKAHRDPDTFWGKIIDWADATITPADYEEEARIVKEVIENAFSTRAVPLDDGNIGGELSGN